ncbi:MAG: DCC1-like thiol-disulfide oxidoreductase family protein [Myxococcota bacterium]
MEEAPPDLAAQPAAPSSTTPALTGPIVLYDGLCGFCDASVQWILRTDTSARYRFAALQGDTAAAILARHPEIPQGLDSILLVEPDGTGERVSWHSAAIFRLCAGLPGPWRALAWLGFLPRFLTDLGYRAFARIRYLVWGRRESCRIPSPGERARFLP